MKYSEIQNYIESKENLIKIDLSLVKDEDDDELYVVKTKETFSYDTEEEADAKIDAIRQDIGFAGVEKKYKAGKVNKAGEILKPEAWIAIAKFNK